jgi:hypothetical protein
MPLSKEFLDKLKIKGGIKMPGSLPDHTPEEIEQICKFLKIDPKDYSKYAFNHTMGLYHKFNRHPELLLEEIERENPKKVLEGCTMRLLKKDK